MNSHAFLKYLSLTLLCLWCSWVNANNAVEPTCPSEDLPTFVKAFSVSPELQKTYTATPVTEQLPAYDEKSYPVVIRRKLFDLKPDALALLDPQAQAKAGLKTFWVDEVTLAVHDELGNVLQAFVFEKNTCWNLMKIEQWSVEGLLNEHVPANETPLEREVRKASIYERYGSREEFPLTQYFFVLAQQIDLHAAEQGSVAGATRAIALSYSEMSPEMEPALIEKLLLTHADNDELATMLLASFYCDRGDPSYSGPCQDLPKAKETLVRGVRKLDSAQLYALLGSHYTGDTWGKPDMPRGLACYQEAATRQDAESLGVLARLAQRGEVPQPGATCL
ncbi:hypothetical protein C1884_25125 [Pseudomonas sp. GW460-R15]|nr:hypothetical protein C1887_25830 [Pseudomonas sp. GW456-R21]POA63144.1 hypothetical protein C1884_25125 [Pseudomonas sp. GW460-R15]